MPGAPRTGDRHPGGVRSGPAGHGERNRAEAGVKPAGALQASKRLMKRSFRDQIRAAMKAENEEFSVQIRSDRRQEALRRSWKSVCLDFTGTKKPQQPRST